MDSLFRSALHFFQNKMTSKVYPILLVLSGLGQETSYLFMTLTPDWGINLGKYFLGFFIAFVFYLIAFYLIEQDRLKQSLRIINFFSILFAATLLWTLPTLSNDIHRYLWEGRVQQAGINPYLISPENEGLKDLRDSNYHLMDHRFLTAIYPPGAQLFFRLVTKMSDEVVFLKSILILCYGGCIWILIQILKLGNIPKERVLIFAWNPLVLIETASSGHIDILGVLLLLFSILLFFQNKFYFSGILLSASVLVKYMPIPFLFLWVRQMRIKVGLVFLFMIGIEFMLLYWPYRESFQKIFDSLLTYMGHWQFNGFIYRCVMEYYPERESFIRGSVLLIALEIIYFFWRKTSLLRAVPIVIVSILFLSPVLYPWYLLWLVPFLVFKPILSMIAFTACIQLSYFILPDYQLLGVWQEKEWVLWLEYGTLGGMIIFEWGRKLIVYRNLI